MSRGSGKEGRMRDPLFCKKAVPAPSAKNSYMADGKDKAFVGAGRRWRNALPESFRGRPQGRLYSRERGWRGRLCINIVPRDS